MIWVYGICERPDMPPPRRHGIAEAPLDGVREGELLAVVSRHAHPPSDPALEAMCEHERVVERMMADRAVLPMRFGSKLPDEGALRDVLATRQQEFLATLERVRGRIEVGVRAMQPLGRDAPLPVPPPRAAASGREYLEAKLHNERRADREAGALHEPLAELAVEVRRQPARSPDELLRAAYLVETSVLARFRATAERLQQAHPGIAILCTGPWPPYSFVGPAALASEPVAGGIR